MKISLCVLGNGVVYVDNIRYQKLDDFIQWLREEDKLVSEQNK